MLLLWRAVLLRREAARHESGRSLPIILPEAIPANDEKN
jgi:hypothetical protein